MKPVDHDPAALPSPDPRNPRDPQITGPYADRMAELEREYDRAYDELSERWVRVRQLPRK